MTNADDLERTLRAAAQNPATVDETGEPLASGLHGMTEHRTRTHVDDRGSVTELFDTRWGWHPDPLVFAYTYTIRPGRAKGWGLHKLHQDRYFLLRGRMEIVLYDVRPDSPTRGKVHRLFLSEENPRIINIPTFVWHANMNIGTDEVRVINFPTTPYDHAAPDKFTLPLDTDEIPYRLPEAIRSTDG